MQDVSTQADKERYHQELARKAEERKIRDARRLRSIGFSTHVDAPLGQDLEWTRMATDLQEAVVELLMTPAFSPVPFLAAGLHPHEFWAAT